MPACFGIREAIILGALGRSDLSRTLLDSLRASSVRRADSLLVMIIDCISGKKTPTEMIDSVREDRLHPNRLKNLCEAYFYAGMASRPSQDIEQARDYFQRCLDTRLEVDPEPATGDPMSEFELAEWQLNMLGVQSSDTTQQEIRGWTAIQFAWTVSH